MPTERTACLRWITDAKSGCSTAEEIAASVESVLNRQVFVANHCDIRVRGSMSPSPKGGWYAKVSFATKDGRSLGTRHLDGPDVDCASLRGPISLAIALMVDTTDTPIVITESATPALKTNAATTTAAESVTPASAELKSPTVAPSQHRAYADLRGSYGLLPGASLGTSLGFDATLSGVVPSRVEATLWFPKSTSPGPGGRFWAWHAGLALCPSLNTSVRPRVTLCASAQVGLIHATGVDLDDTESIRRPYGHAETRMIFSIPLGGAFAVSTHIALAVPMMRPRFAYLDPARSEREVHQPNAAILMGGVGLIWRDSNSSLNQPPAP